MVTTPGLPDPPPREPAVPRPAESESAALPDGNELDGALPARGFERLPVVGLGGSAGSIAALARFFENTPPATGAAYVVILHLAPDHHSLLPELLQNSTSMTVQAARDGIALAPDHVYVIPPAKQLTTTNGHLRLTDLKIEPGRRVAVDLFFRSLADTHGPQATAIVLSGGDGDGASGLKRIKERGGLTIAQDPGEAEHPSMPRTAITTGMVDWVLRVAEMPQRIVDYRAREARLRLPPEESPQPASLEPAADRERRLRDILDFIRSRTGRDFSYYKRATVVRRISRRMQVCGVEELADYLEALRTRPGEAAALVSELLISVTNFFRDGEAFEALAPEIASMLQAKGPDQVFRVWVAACATGEEVYSMAMLLLEHTRHLDAPPRLQIFACDLDDDAIRFARAGVYSESIAADVSEERLQRFFTRVPSGYAVRREVREMVLFAAHDLLKDAPFSRIDLVSCRNLLIYLNRSAQTRCFEIFNFSLNPGGLLFLGSSETVPEGSVLFDALEKRHRIYRQRPTERPVMLNAGGRDDQVVHRVLQQHETMKHAVTVLPGHGLMARGTPHPPIRASGALGELPPAAELHLRLLGRWGPASVLVDADHDIVHLSENASRFLRFPEGELTSNLLRLVQPALRVDLRAALLAAEERGQPVEIQERQVALAAGPVVLALRVAPAGELAPGHFLVMFDARETAAANGASSAILPTVDTQIVVAQLEQELTRASARLRTTIEQYEISNEELKASNEELQAMNEELHSAGEELESGREELQSVNEELTTLNTEFRNRVEELSRANSDLHNLMSATQIATVFLDRGLRIMRYTPSAAPLFNLIAGDIGRPISDLKRRLDYPELVADAEQVLRTLVPVDRETSADGRWLLAQVLPYRTVEDRIAGVVLTFVDITDRRSFEGALRTSEEQFRRAIEEAPIPVIMQAEDGQVLQISKAWTALTGFASEDVRTFDAWLGRAYGPGADHVRDRMRELFKGTAGVLDAELDVTTRDGSTRHWIFSASAPGVLRDGRRFVVGMASDVTERRHAEARLRESEKRLRAVVERTGEEAVFSLDLEGRVTSWDDGAQALFGHTPDEAIGRSADELFTAEDRAAGLPRREADDALAAGRTTGERWHLRKDGSRFRASGTLMAMRDGAGRAFGLVRILRADVPR
jgi:two-component system CheB/CheR fusion protein